MKRRQSDADQGHGQMEPNSSEEKWKWSQPPIWKSGGQINLHFLSLSKNGGGVTLQQRKVTHGIIQHPNSAQRFCDVNRDSLITSDWILDTPTTLHVTLPCWFLERKK